MMVVVQFGHSCRESFADQILVFRGVDQPAVKDAEASRPSGDLFDFGCFEFAQFMSVKFFRTQKNDALDRKIEAQADGVG